MGELAASIAHEVKQPLTAVVNNATACISLLPTNGRNLEDVREALEEIVEDANRASSVMTRVRELARKAEIESTLLDLKNVVTEAIALTRYESHTRRVAIDLVLPEEFPLVFGGSHPISTGASQSNSQCNGRDDNNRALRTNHRRRRTLRDA